MNLTQLLMTRENVDRISQQFGLSEQETVDAMQSLIPAFSEGLKRQTASDHGAVDLIQALATGGHARYVDNPELAMRDEGIRDGNAILGHLFGKKDVSRAVAGRASASSGLAPSLLKSLLPVIASMVMGALFKGATVRDGPGGALGDALGTAAGGGLLGAILEGLVGCMASGARTRRRHRRGGGLDDLLGQVLGGATQRQPGRAPRRGQQPAPRRRRTTGRGNAGGGLGGMLEDLLGGGQRVPPRKQARQRDPVMPPPRTGRVRRVSQSREIHPEDVFGDMFEPGGNTTHQYRRKTRDVFDQLLGN